MMNIAVVFLCICLVNVKTYSLLRMKRGLLSTSRVNSFNDFMLTKSSRVQGKKIEEEESSLNKGPNKSTKKKKIKNVEGGAVAVTSSDEVGKEQERGIEENKNIVEIPMSPVEFDEGSFEFVLPPSTDNSEEDSKKKRSRGNVDKTSTVRQQQLPPEVVFFGDPRRPPPSEAAQESRFHGSLLFWARHAYAAPVSSFDRANTVFPSVATASTLRVSGPLSYQNLFNSFLGIKDNLEASKDFISANIDLVPPTLFLRALTAKKLKAQFENNIAEMETLKEVRSKYILAQDQLFFPLNIEIRKAETRAMTFIARSEITEFAKEWDEVETTLYFLTMLTARLTWDDKVKRLLDRIKKKVSETVDYMADGVKRDLMTREFRRPGITSEIYTNATIVFAMETPKLYKKVIPEVKIIFETYGLSTSAEIKSKIMSFCQESGIDIADLKNRLKVLSTTLTGIQGTDYTAMRARVERLRDAIQENGELEAESQWYRNEFTQGYGFTTYRPDVVPNVIYEELKYRDTGNSFLNFGMDVFKMPAVPTEAFSRNRPTASEAQKWLDRDPDWNSPFCPSYKDQLESFVEAYNEQSKLRQEAEGKLDRVIFNRMEEQDRALRRQLLEFSPESSSLT